MNQTLVFGPMLAMFLLTIGVWVHMYIKRIGLIRAHRLRADDVTHEKLAEISPPDVSNPSDNLKNLFEVPTIFYAFVLYLYMTSQADPVYLAGCWAFAGLRVVHSAIHCTFNRVMLRFLVYVASTLVLWAMIIRAVIHYLQAG